MHEDPVQRNDSTRKIGSGMVVAAWILVLGIATLYFDKFLDRQHNPNMDVAFSEDAASREVVLQRNRAGHYITSGRINDRDVAFLVDTGATDVSIPERIARRLKLERGAEQLAGTANGTIVVYHTVLDRIELGNIVLRDVRASINPHMRADEILLGMSFLKHLEFTQRGDRLILRQYN